jgi:hypothetical protein
MQKITFVVSSFALFAIVSVQAATIVSTFGPGQSFQSPPGLTIGGGILRGDQPPQQGVTAAFEFTASATLSLTQIDLAMQYFLLAGRATGAANLDVSIANNNLGQPGTPLETIHLMNALGSVPFTPGIVTALSSSHPLLQAGTPYWLVVAPPDLLNTAFDWLISPINPLPTLQASRLGNGPWVTGVTPQPLAFDVIGTTSAPVPEPSTGPMMLLAALGGLAIWRRTPARMPSWPA